MANPNEGGDGGDKKTSIRNTSADDEEGEVVGCAWQKTRETPIFKKGRRKVNRPPRFTHCPVPSKLSHCSAQLRPCHRLAAPL
jgi:hypothetical protein